MAHVAKEVKKTKQTVRVVHDRVCERERGAGRHVSRFLAVAVAWFSRRPNQFSVRRVQPSGGQELHVHRCGALALTRVLSDDPDMEG